jgi:DNA-binding NarL/FixJ family response regulator
MARKSPKPKPAKGLSAHQAGKLAPHKKKQSVRYDPNELPEPTEPLTVREEETLSLLSENKSNQDISKAIGAKVGTVEKHVEHLYPKLRVNSRAGAAIWFLTRRIKQLERENAKLKRRLKRGAKNS